MSLRDRLLALLRDPAYSPANEFELARRLDLRKRDRATLAHEVRLLLKNGTATRGGNGRIAARRGGDGGRREAEPRKIFVPTRRGPTLPAPDEPPSSATKHRSPVDRGTKTKAGKPPRIPEGTLAPTARPAGAPPKTPFGTAGIEEPRLPP